MTLAEALVMKKHLQLKVQQLHPLKVAGEGGVFETKVTRENISENIDEVKMTLPKIELKDLTAEYDKYSKALRELDTAIQATNWKTKLVDGPDLKDIAI